MEQRNTPGVEKIRYAGTSLRVKVPRWNPVVQGVLEALDEMGEVPSYIRSISVVPDTKFVSKRDPGGNRKLRLGETQIVSGNSHVKIYAGSMNKAEWGSGAVRELSRETVHHEAGHAALWAEVQEGFWELGSPSLKEEEDKAREYAFKQTR
jgi:hypothetical protein